jgi:hypothetical protein
MKKIIMFFITVSVIIACNKIEVPKTPPVLVVQEEPIKFITNLDTGTYNIADTLPLIVTVSSKLPTSGLIFSITINWVDSSKQVYKIDTSITQSILNLNITGLNKVGNYSLTVSVTSKSSISNTLLKTLSVFKNNFTLYTTTIPLNINGFSKEDIASGIDGSVSGSIYDFVSGRERLVVSPTLFFRYPLLPSLNFTKSGGTWSLENSYLSGAMGAGRNYELMDSVKRVWVIADHGLELSTGTWPYGSIYVMSPNGNGLSYTNISNSRSFYHSLSSGDLNNDGLKDIVGLNMGVRGDWYGNLHAYLQNTDGSFSEARNLINDGLNTWSMNKGAGAVLIADVIGDKRPEIIRADYGLNTSYQSQSDRYSIVIYSYDNNLGKYTVVKNPGSIGVYANNDRGTTSIKANDFDNDGDLDIAVATEGTNFMGVEIWKNDGLGNFTPTSNKLEFSFDQMQFREFNVIDANSDGFLDIVLIPFAFGKLFRVGGNGSNWGTGGIYLNNLLWMNNKGTFSMYNKQVIVPNIKPAYIKSAKINGQFRFIGIETSVSNSSVNLYEIPFIF